MSDTEPAPVAALVPESFASGVAAHFQRFIAGATDPEETLVKITLMNHEAHYFMGLRISHVANAPGCVMVRGVVPKEREAIVIREDHILMAEFDMEPTPTSTFGFP